MDIQEGQTDYREKTFQVCKARIWVLMCVIFSDALSIVTKQGAPGEAQLSQAWQSAPARG